MNIGQFQALSVKHAAYSFQDPNGGEWLTFDDLTVKEQALFGDSATFEAYLDAVRDAMTA